MATNGASRLHTFFSQAKGSPNNRPTVQAWASAVGVEPKFEIVLPYLAEILTQLDDIEEQVRSKYSQRKAETLLAYFGDFRRAVAHEGMGGGWEPVKNLLSDAALYSLKTMEHELDDEPEIKADVLETLKKELDELFTMVNNSGLNTKLKSWLLSWISALRQGIVRFQVSGTKGLQDALIRIQGEADIFAPALDQIKQVEPKVFERVNSVFVTTCKIAELADRCQRLCTSSTAVHVFSLGLRALEQLPLG